MIVIMRDMLGRGELMVKVDIKIFIDIMMGSGKMIRGMV
jgi:hypothetical protein